VFVPFVLAGERVEAGVVEERAGFARARLERVVEPSPLRVEAPCPYYQRCGGCHYQHTSYEHQIEVKTAILRENLRRLAKLDWPGEIAVHRGEAWQYRNRTRVQVRTEPEFAVAYYRHGSHELLPIEQCPISSPLVNRVITALYEVGRDGGFPAEVREVEFFADALDANLLLEFYVAAGARLSRAALEAVWQGLRARVPELSGIAVFEAPTAEREFREARRVARAGTPELLYRAGGHDYHVSAGAFFQTNRFLADELLRVVTADAAGALALDLYAGVGLFARALAQNFARVIALEASNASFRDLQRNLPPHAQPVHDATDHYLARARLPGIPDLVVVDPPRSGLGDKVTRALTRIAPPRLTYVSCDPATLARDLRALLAGGFRVEQIHLVDLFPQTFHLESVVQLAR